MMRRSIFLFSIAAAVILLVPAEGFAKGSTLRFDEATYAPGAHAVAYAVVETWPGTGEPGEGPFIIYLVGGFQALWYGHLPKDAIPLGRLRIGKPLGTNEYRVTAAFDVPRVPDGRYDVWVCSRLCGANTGFGDLVYGRLTVARDDRPGVGDVMPLAPFEAGGIDMAKIAPWLVGSIAVIGAVSATLVVTRRRRG